MDEVEEKSNRAEPGGGKWKVRMRRVSRRSAPERGREIPAAAA